MNDDNRTSQEVGKYETKPTSCCLQTSPGCIATYVATRGPTELGDNCSQYRTLWIKVAGRRCTDQLGRRKPTNTVTVAAIMRGVLNSRMGSGTRQERKAIPWHNFPGLSRGETAGVRTMIVRRSAHRIFSF